LKEWNSSNIWEKKKKKKIIFRRKLKAEVRERLLSFGAKSFVFQFVIQKYKD
jgi:hypothetical protein